MEKNIFSVYTITGSALLLNAFILYNFKFMHCVA